jgi:hypothetical protein
MMLARIFVCLTIITLTGCGSVSLRDDAFLRQPIWESSKFVSIKGTISTRNAPGLFLLVDQVLKTPPKPGATVIMSSAPGIAAGASAQGVVRADGLVEISAAGPGVAAAGAQPVYATLGTKDLVVYDTKPLPEDLAKHPVTRAFVQAMYAAAEGKILQDQSI